MCHTHFLTSSLSVRCQQCFSETKDSSILSSAFFFVVATSDLFCLPRLTPVLSWPRRLQGITSESDPTGSYAGIESVLSELTQRRDEMAELWGTRKLRLDLSMRLRMFERNVMEVGLEAGIVDWTGQRGEGWGQGRGTSRGPAG